MKDFTHDVLGKMIWIPPPRGWYLMSDFQGGEYNPETSFVKLTKGFWIQEKPYSEDGKTPKVNVSWDETNEIANHLSHKKSKYIFRLPTEAEWQWAASGAQNFIWAGSNDPDEVAWTRENSGAHIHAMGEKKPNMFGLYDMSGNVWEWVRDVHAHYPGGIATDPVGPSSGPLRFSRGGSCYYGAALARVAYRDRGFPGNRSAVDLGFRLICQEKS